MTVNEQTTTSAVTGERADLLAMLAEHRHFLRFTTRGLTDEQAGQRTTASELCLGGLIKHVAAGERNWVNFLLEGPSAMGDFSSFLARNSGPSGPGGIASLVCGALAPPG